MTPSERIEANRDFIDGIEVRIAAMEREIGNEQRVEPEVIDCREGEIGFVWPMGFQNDHDRLRALKARLVKIKRDNPPEPDLPPLFHFVN